MKRREFITLLGGAAASWPLAARAQQAGKLRTIGSLGAPTLISGRGWLEAFVQRLRELGWFEGQTIAIEVRWADGRAERYSQHPQHHHHRKRHQAHAQQHGRAHADTSVSDSYRQARIYAGRILKGEKSTKVELDRQGARHGKRIYVTVTGHPSQRQDGLLALPVARPTPKRKACDQTDPRP